MKDYKLPQEELNKGIFDAGFTEEYEAGYRDAEDRLIPIVEEKDKLLEECKEWILVLAPHWSPDHQIYKSLMDLHQKLQQDGKDS